MPCRRAFPCRRCPPSIPTRGAASGTHLYLHVPPRVRTPFPLIQLLQPTSPQLLASTLITVSLIPSSILSIASNQRATIPSAASVQGPRQPTSTKAISPSFHGPKPSKDRANPSYHLHVPHPQTHQQPQEPSPWGTTRQLCSVPVLPAVNITVNATPHSHAAGPHSHGSIGRVPAVPAVPMVKIAKIALTRLRSS